MFLFRTQHNSTSHEPSQLLPFLREVSSQKRMQKEEIEVISRRKDNFEPNPKIDADAKCEPESN